jgi:hypothetical protein
MACKLNRGREYRCPICPTFKTMIGKKKGDCHFFIVSLGDMALENPYITLHI